MDKQLSAHWIIVEDCEPFIAKCSACGHIEDSRLVDRIPRCSKCGAEMENSKNHNQNNVDVYVAMFSGNKKDIRVSVFKYVTEKREGVFVHRSKNGIVTKFPEECIGKSSEERGVGFSEEDAVNALFGGVSVHLRQLENEIRRERNLLKCPIDHPVVFE